MPNSLDETGELAGEEEGNDCVQKKNYEHNQSGTRDLGRGAQD